ncbi:phage major capsid protein [Tateyamaria sp. syn59]|uniref:phage major capsid protein n=1 Tax=Tateyamaria sp. syn59 TaxID=2576942 RepID=UPI0011BDF6A2|nr:phage major capsid protein [Tateyamaria sp. syn59]
MTKMMKAAVPFAVLTAMANVPAAVMSEVTAEGGTNPEQMITALTKKVDDMAGPIKATAEKALDEVKNFGKVTEETKANADKALADITATTKAVEELKASIAGIDAKMLDVSQQLAAGGGGGSGGQVMTLGQAVAAEDEKIASFVGNSCNGNLLIRVENAITTAGGSAGGLISAPEETEPVRLARRTLRIWQLLAQGRTGQDMVHYRRQVLRNNAAAMVAEGGVIPPSEYGYDKDTAPVKKIAHITNISEEAMADADQLQTEIDSELRYGLDLEREMQILAGDGAGENLDGLVPNATAFVAAAGLPNQTRIDRLRLALLQLTLQDYMGTSIVLNPTDWAAIDLLKDTQSRYIYGNPGVMSSPMLWGKTVVESNSMAAGEWLVGDLEMAATMYRRKDVEVLISSEHGTNFVEGMLTMKGTERLALAIKRALAMVTGDFTFA